MPCLTDHLTIKILDTPSQSYFEHVAIHLLQRVAGQLTLVNELLYIHHDEQLAAFWPRIDRCAAWVRSAANAAGIDRIILGFLIVEEANELHKLLRGARAGVELREVLASGHDAITDLKQFVEESLGAIDRSF